MNTSKKFEVKFTIQYLYDDENLTPEMVSKYISEYLEKSDLIFKHIFPVPKNIEVKQIELIENET